MKRSAPWPTQVPAAQAWPAEHARPQAPQLALSLVRSRHTPEQLVVPAAHDTLHAPAAHTWPAEHTWPQRPQLVLSVLRLRHTPEQLVCPVGHDTTPEPLHYPDVDADEVGRWASDCDDFAAWATSLGSAGPLLAMPDRMHLATHIPADGPVSRGVQLLRLTACPTTAASFVELLGVWGGIGWLGGLSAALAVSVAPPPEGHEFRPVDLPADGGQRGHADYLLRLAISAFGGGGWIENFRRTHIDVRVVPAPSARSAAATELVTTTEDVERPTIGPAAQAAAEEPAAADAKSIRMGKEFAAIAMLRTVGFNVTEIAKRTGLSRPALYRMPTFVTALRHARAERQQAADRLSGNVHGRDAGRNADIDDE